MGDEATRETGASDVNCATNAQSPVRVFISYSHDSPAHKLAVLDLANRLRADGIDASIDQYVAAPPEGWPRWMTNQVEQSRYIVLVCTESYKRRFEGRENPGTGKGTTWEGLLATQVLYDAGTINDKLIPLLLDGVSDAHIPLTLKPYTNYRLPAGYDALYRHLTGQPAVVAPPLGKVRVMPSVTRGPALAPQPVVSSGLPPTLVPGRAFDRHNGPDDGRPRYQIERTVGSDDSSLTSARSAYQSIKEWFVLQWYLPLAVAVFGVALVWPRSNFTMPATPSRDALSDHEISLSRAASDGNLNGVKAILGAAVHGQVLNVAQAGRESIVRGREDILLALLDYAAEHDADRIEGVAAGEYWLIGVAERGMYTATSRLLDWGFSAASIDGQYDSPLKYAALRGQLSTVRLLIARGAPVERPNRIGLTPLLAAISAGKLDVVRELIIARSSVDQVYEPPRSLGALLTRREAQLGAPSSKNGFLHPWMNAVAADREAFSKCLSLVTQDHVTALSLAIRCGYPNIARELLDSGAKIETQTVEAMTPLMQAAAVGDPETVQLLVERGARPAGLSGIDSTSAISYAAQSAKCEDSDCQDRYSKVVGFLVQAGASPSAPDEFGSSPLHYAVGYTKTKPLQGKASANAGVVRVLVGAGAELNALDRDHRTPLLLSVVAGRPDLADLLLESKADPEVPDGNGWTPLLHAVSRCDSAMVEVLLRHGASPLEPSRAWNAQALAESRGCPL